uniref:restriction endonuclease subunit S n=1 Tax=Eubacterium sp. TaxID=142586 RepID=UPI004029B2C4
MRTDYKVLGNYIRLVDERNRDLSVTNLLGVSIGKKFIPSIANIVGTDLSSYKIVRTGQFAYGPVTSRNGEKISIAYLDGDDCIISSSYTVFEVSNKEELDPEYLMLWFSRPEFDRYARYKSHGSVREIFDWNELCMVELPVPDIKEQKNIVKAYKTITDRIALKKQINDNLEATAQAVLQENIVEKGVETTVDSIITLFDNLRHPLSGLDRRGMEKIYPYYGAASLMDYVDDYIFDGIYGLLGEDGTVMDESGYPNMQYVWGKFWVNNHAHIFQGKNSYSTEMAYLILKNTAVRNAVTGAVQLKINQENLRNLPIIVPSADDIPELDNKIQTIFKKIRENCDEIEHLSNLEDILLAKISA